MANTQTSLADYALIHATGSQLSEGDALKYVARHLPRAKRMTFDELILETVNQTSAIDTEEIIGQLQNTTFPFDMLWIAGPTFLPYIRHGVSEEDILTQPPRVGLLVKLDQKNHEFEFWMVKEHINATRMYRQLGVSIAGTEMRKLLDRTDDILVECKFDYSVKVSLEAGIDLREDTLISELAKYQVRYDKGLGKGIVQHSDETINDLFSAADFLARFLVVLGSKRFTNNLQQVAKEQSVDWSRLNRKRISQGKLPHVPSSAIRIDIAEADRRILASAKPKKIRELLGWTSVSRSREIISKHGIKFYRKAHPRRIPAPVDRRDAVREITAGKAVTLVIDNNQRPAVVRVPEPSDPANDKK